MRDNFYFSEKTGEMFQANGAREEEVIAITLCERVDILQTTANQQSQRRLLYSDQENRLSRGLYNSKNMCMKLQCTGYHKANSIRQRVRQQPEYIHNR